MILFSNEGTPERPLCELWDQVGQAVSKFLAQHGPNMTELAEMRAAAHYLSTALEYAVSRARMNELSRRDEEARKNKIP